ncbi:acetylornithine deacetylase [Flavobacteriaceae bacterium UJ101]|nr:acetylornithine deacetylase [Flavobacteriaceae bacterium UJ101]
MSIKLEKITDDCIQLLKEMIAIPSFSREEKNTADALFSFFEQYGCHPKRLKNNVWCESTNYTDNAPVILLNSHHDTVKFGEDWLTDPHTPTLDGDKLTGLGSNDAGASVVSLIATFIYLSQLPQLPYKLIIAISAEEEVSGQNGIRLLLPQLGKIDLGIVGEPTQMRGAIAEKGLIVLDCIAHGKTGHAAREEGENALYKALEDIRFFQNHPFQKESSILGKTKMTVTQIESGTQHNVVPDRCHFVVDIRTNELYQNTDVIEEVKKHIQSEITPRSYHLNSSRIDPEHPLVKKLLQMGRKTYGSPTLSDQASMNFQTIKLGPGMSARSHTPNEFIYLSEIKEGIQLYIELLEDFNFNV